MLLLSLLIHVVQFVLIAEIVDSEVGEGNFNSDHKIFGNILSIMTDYRFLYWQVICYVEDLAKANLTSEEVDNWEHKAPFDLRLFLNHLNNTLFFHAAYSTENMFTFVHHVFSCTDASEI